MPGLFLTKKIFCCETNHTVNFYPKTYFSVRFSNPYEHLEVSVFGIFLPESFRDILDLIVSKIIVGLWDTTRKGVSQGLALTIFT